MKGGRSQVVLELIDATAMLWRLHLRGVDVGERWAPVADDWEAVGGAGIYAFNDWHAGMAFVGAGPARRAGGGAGRGGARRAGARRQRRCSRRDVGLPLIRAVQAFGAGDYAEAARLLRSVREIAHRFGGSHAQRDLIDLTLIEAAIRGGDASLAAALAAERAALKPHSPVALGFVRRAAALRQQAA